MPLSILVRSSLWRSLRHRNYRLYLAGQLVSVCGTWMQQVALSWLVYRLTGSATLLGVVGFATQVPVLALGAAGGVVSDRYSPHRVALLTQCAALVQAVTLAALALSGWIQSFHIILLGVISGMVNAFDMPARQALVYQLVDAEDLPNAVALNSSMINAARIVGPGLAGLVIAKLGEGACFLINALSYLAVITALVAMDRPTARTLPVKKISFADSLQEGLRYGHGDALHYFDAGIRGRHSSERRGCAGDNDGGRRLRSADRRAFSGAAQIHHRPRPCDRTYHTRFWGRFGRVYAFGGVLAVAFLPRLRRYDVDGCHRGQQHRFADSRRRRDARPGDESLYHDAGRHGAVWKPLGRLANGSFRRVNRGCRR